MKTETKTKTSQIPDSRFQNQNPGPRLDHPDKKQFTDPLPPLVFAG
jgi:hypothetical protein